MRTPGLDQFMRSETPQAAKSLNNDLSQIQTFMLDTMAPLTALLDNNLSVEEMRTSLAAAELIGNTNSHLTQLRREKLVSTVTRPCCRW